MRGRAPFVASCVGGTISGDRSVLVPWWSITKSCLAACVLVLVEQGRLDLDCRIEGRAFTLRQLLQHTSGLACYTEHPEYDRANNAHDEPWSHTALLAQSETAPVLFAPGQGWSYSNTGYFLVRRLIEDVTGLDIERSLKTLVLTPLGIQHAFIARTREDLRKSELGDEDGFHPGWVAHGLLMGPPAEAALFMHGLFTGTLLPQMQLAAMCERRAVDVELPDRPWRTAGYGLGLMMDIASPLGLCIGHSGQGPDSVAAAYHFSDRDPPLTVAAFAPTDDQGIAERAVLEEAARLIESARASRA
jgi:CubicO group peptidase (beta-lactamase class C family)